jgi:hypothetical protein
MSDHWFRFYAGVPDDPKIGLLSAQSFRAWVSDHLAAKWTSWRREVGFEDGGEQ